MELSKQALLLEALPRSLACVGLEQGWYSEDRQGFRQKDRECRPRPLRHARCV